MCDSVKYFPIIVEGVNMAICASVICVNKCTEPKSAKILKHFILPVNRRSFSYCKGIECLQKNQLKGFFTILLCIVHIGNELVQCILHSSLANNKQHRNKMRQKRQNEEKSSNCERQCRCKFFVPTLQIEHTRKSSSSGSMGNALK